MTDPAVKVALISATGVVIAAVFTLLGVWLTQRQARKAVDAGAYERAQRIYDASIEELTERIERLTAEMAELRSKHTAEIQILQNRIDVMEMRRDADTNVIRKLQAYVQQLLAVLRDAGMTAPEPPDGLVLDHLG